MHGDHLLKSIEQYKVLQNTFNFDSLLWKVKLFIFCGDNTTVRNPADFLSVSRDHRTGRGSSGIRSTFFDTLVRSIFDVVESVMIPKNKVICMRFLLKDIPDIKIKNSSNIYDR